MTNPAQLKYLDAMGIPVWVSRDLVQGLEQNNGETTTLDKVAVGSGSGSFQVEASHEHVGSLLHDLDAQAQAGALQTPHNQVVASTSTVSTTQATSVASASTHKVSKQAAEIGRTALHTIYACGDLNADWMVIGESPDVSTNGQQQPYAGDSGVLLSNMLRAVGIQEPRKQAYLINILKNSVQNEAGAEITQLNSLLKEKIQQVKPKLLLLVGQIAAQNLLNSKEPLARLRGRRYILPDSQIPLVVTYYPSYLLSKPIDKRKAWEDLKLAVLAMKTVL